MRWRQPCPPSASQSRWRLRCFRLATRASGGFACPPNPALTGWGKCPCRHTFTGGWKTRNGTRRFTRTGRAASPAPTAGLHFTPELLEAMRAKGVETAFVTLHVGLDTFRPVSEDNPAEHAIHTEYYEMPAETAAILTRARAEGRPILAVGTTSVRTLEQVARDRNVAGAGESEPIRAVSGQADLFILPGHRFRLVEGMITNFHLPRSTLVMLVSAFAGRENILAAYQEAIERRYRFYSFGDAMLIR